MSWGRASLDRADLQNATAKTQTTSIQAPYWVPVRVVVPVSADALSLEARLLLLITFIGVPWTARLGFWSKPPRAKERAAAVSRQSLTQVPSPQFSAPG